VLSTGWRVAKDRRGQLARAGVNMAHPSSGRWLCCCCVCSCCRVDGWLSSCTCTCVVKHLQVLYTSACTFIRVPQFEGYSGKCCISDLSCCATGCTTRQAWQLASLALWQTLTSFKQCYLLSMLSAVHSLCLCIVNYQHLYQRQPLLSQALDQRKAQHCYCSEAAEASWTQRILAGTQTRCTSFLKPLLEVRTAGPRLTTQQQFPLGPVARISVALGFQRHMPALLTSIKQPDTVTISCSRRMEPAGCLLHVRQQQAAALCLAPTAQAAPLPCLACNSSSRCSQCQDTCCPVQGNISC
jgi:hypothetical protein